MAVTVTVHTDNRFGGSDARLRAGGKHFNGFLIFFVFFTFQNWPACPAQPLTPAFRSAVHVLRATG